MNDAAHNREVIKKMEETIRKELKGNFDPNKAREIFHRELAKIYISGCESDGWIYDGTADYIDLDAMNDEAIIFDFNQKIES